MGCDNVLRSYPMPCNIFERETSYSSMRRPIDKRTSKETISNFPWHIPVWEAYMSIEPTSHSEERFYGSWGKIFQIMPLLQVPQGGTYRNPCPLFYVAISSLNIFFFLSWTCHIYGPFEFRTSLGTSILLSIPLLTDFSIPVSILISPTSGGIQWV